MLESSQQDRSASKPHSILAESCEKLNNMLTMALPQISLCMACNSEGVGLMAVASQAIFFRSGYSMEVIFEFGVLYRHVFDIQTIVAKIISSRMAVLSPFYFIPALGACVFLGKEAYRHLLWNKINASFITLGSVMRRI